MPVIRDTIKIKAPIVLCFDLARSIDLHKISTGKSNEKAIEGVSSGLIGLGQEVMWEATHFGIRQTLRSRITAFRFPFYFRDEMVHGAFKLIRHDHHFTEQGEFTIMQDVFEFESPLGVMGRIVNKLVLTKYMKELLINRNKVIKDYAESTKWKLVLQPHG